MILCSHLNFDEDMNGLEWRLVLPKYADIADGLKPRCVGDYLPMMKQLDIVDVDEYDIALACAYLDQVYDFTPPSAQGAKAFQPVKAIKVSCFSSSMQANCAAMGFLPAVISNLKASPAEVM